jgi:CDP-diacylglycerol---glycerol-3-phosphate 3-phosphatidyltransferase
VTASETGYGRSRWAWVPNALTIARLAALPVLLWILVTADGTTSVLGWAVFSVTALTDFLDGWLARRLGAESTFGRIADPLADRLLVAVGLVGVMILGSVPLAAPLVLLVRDVVIVACAAALLRTGIDLRVDMPGKISSALTMTATGFAILLDQVWVEVLMWVAVALALGTFANYARQAVALLRARAAEPSTMP